MVNVEAWAPYLNNPLTLIGFVFFIAASILTLRPSEKLPQKTAPMLFLLVFVVIIGSFWLAYRQLQPLSVLVYIPEKNTFVKNDSDKTKKQDVNESSITNRIATKGSVSQESKGNKSPNIVSGGNAAINY